MLHFHRFVKPEALTAAQARATHGAFQGTWYFEIKITKLGKSGHVRLGWSTRKGDLQAPVGASRTLMSTALSSCCDPACVTLTSMLQPAS